MTQWIRMWAGRHPVVMYFAVAYVITWTLWLPHTARALGFELGPSYGETHYLGSFGPLLSALFVTALVDGRRGLSQLLRRVVRWRFGVQWWLVVLGSPLALYAVAAGAARLVTGAWPDLGRLGEVNFLGDIGWWSVPLWLATFGFGEETGWRGFALPRLQATRSPGRATLVLWVGWAVWHIPALPYLMAGESPFIVVGFFVGMLFGALLLTWLFNSTGGSVLAVALWHGVFDLLTASRASEGTAAFVMSAGVIVWAMVVARRTSPDRLTGWGISSAAEGEGAPVRHAMAH